MIIWLFLFSASIFYPSTSLDLTGSEYEETVKSQGCFTWCVARCLSDDKTTTEDCSKRCTAYNETGLCKDSNCWVKCRDLLTSDSSGTPIQVQKLKAIQDSQNSEVILLNWETDLKAKLHLILFKDTDDKFDRWETVNELINGSEYSLVRPYFCLKYSFKVAAVSASGIGPFSSVTTIGKPQLNISQSSAVLKLDRVVNTSTNILATMHYDLSPAWKAKHLDTGKTAVQVFAVKTPNGINPSVRLSENSTTVELPISRTAMEFRSKYLLSINKIYSVCGTNVSFDFTIEDSLAVDINCDTVENSGCTLKKPNCFINTYCLQSNEMNVSWIQPNITQADPSVCNFTTAVLSWDPALKLDQNRNRCRPIKYQIQYGLAKQDTAIFQDLVQSIDNQSLDLPPTETSHEFPFLTLGNLYYFSVCAVYIIHPEINEIEWAIISKKSANSKDSLNACLAATAKSVSPSQTKMIIAVTVLIAAALISVGVTVFCVIRSRRERERLKKVEQMISGRFERKGNEYVWIEKPIVKEKWELDRQRLIVYDTDKPLGAGAFGKVLKGRVVGKIQTHKDSQSVLAQKQEELRDCLVAVKQCYEYADKATKSQFRQEIELMKMLGHHPHLVNMLYCISDTEPLCLVVEFCEGGDLRQYLRNNRKYMLDLERLGIDLTTDIKADEAAHGKILCVKDLVLFAFQISDGLEYLHQKGYIHRDLAARNVLLDKNRCCKIGDFGLCRYVETDPAYISHGGKVPIKWMALEALKEYRFSTENDIWSFGILLFEIITLGGTPYPDVLPQDGDFQKAMIEYLESGRRLEQPDNCPNQLYDMMKECWSGTPEKRPSVSDLRERLRQMLESIVKEKDDMYLDPNRSYYNVNEAWDEERISEEVQPEESAASEADKGGQANEAYVEDDSAFDPVKPTLSLRQTAVAEAGPIVPYPRPTRPRLTSPSVTSTDSFANSFDSDWSDRRSDGPLISPHHGKVLNDYKGILNNNYTLDPLKEQDIYGEKQVENDSTPPEIQTGTAYVKL